MSYEKMIQNIERLSAERGVSKTTALVNSGVGKNFICNINRGSNPSTEKIQQLAAYFNVTTDYLLGNENKNAPSVSDEDIKFALFKGTEEITDEMYEEVKAFAKFVKEREQEKRKK